MDSFRPLSPEEIKLATLQFMGQHLSGEIKELNNNLISQSATLRNLNIDPKHVLNSIPSNTPNTYSTTVNAGINVTQPSVQLQPVALQSQPSIINDPNQLEFDFNNSNYAKLIFDRLDSIERKLQKLLDNN